MKTIKLILAFTGFLLFMACDKDDMIGPDSGMSLDWRDNVPHVTGDVEVMWKGGGMPGPMEGPMADRRGFVDLEAFPATDKKEAKGYFTLRVMDGEDLERQIEANVMAAVVDPEQSKAWFLALVVFDTKACGTHGGPGEDEGGCTGEDEGGCSGEDDGHDGGCTGEDDGGCSGEDDGGCSGEDDGGCSGEDDGGGCSGDDGHDSGSGGPGGQGGGSLNGQRCRIGQIVAVKVHDNGTPGRDGDGLTWKWFRADANNLPDINDVEHWPHLCKKTILEGNLTVH